MLDCQVERLLARDTSLDKQSVHALAGEVPECSFRRLSRPGHDRLNLDAGPLRRFANLIHVWLGEGIGLVSKYADAAGGRNNLADQDRKSTRLNSSHLGISYAVF